MSNTYPRTLEIVCNNFRFKVTKSPKFEISKSHPTCLPNGIQLIAQIAAVKSQYTRIGTGRHHCANLVCNPGKISGMINPVQVAVQLYVSMWIGTMLLHFVKAV